VNVQKLADLLNRAVLDGRGGDEVFVSLVNTNGVIDEPMQDILDRYNWAVTDVDLNDGRSNFVGLDVRPS
jgi:hypothetical protein